MQLPTRHPSSFRDPDGYMFLSDKMYYRHVNKRYTATLDAFEKSGCYKSLIEKEILIPYTDCTKEFNIHDETRILCPEQIYYLTYPYEWSFHQLKFAALCTLDVLEISLNHNFILKDASAYNVTWHNGRMVFLDTLSFIPYIEGNAWSGYRQFCMHFLIPLALQCYTDVRASSILIKFIDGIPLDFATKILPLKTKFIPSLVFHIYLHAIMQGKYGDTKKKIHAKVNKKTIFNLIDSLRHAINSLTMRHVCTEWGDYYNDTNYDLLQSKEKSHIIENMIKEVSPSSVLDLGSNDGTYSRIAAKYAHHVISADIDPLAVDANALNCWHEHDQKIIPVLQDITMPSPAIGWNGEERSSFFTRTSCDLGMALALIHHLAIGNNAPLGEIFSMLRRLAPRWIVEFVSKEDSQVQRLLRNREDIYPNYTESGFEEASSISFKIQKKIPITGTKRIMYLLDAQ